MLTFMVRFHKIDRKYRVHDIGYYQRSQQGNDQGDRQEEHKVADQTVPECQRDKWCQRSHGS